MMKLVVRLTCLLALLIGGLAAPGTALAAASPAPAAGASAAYVCDEWGVQAGIYSGSGTRWGYVNLVNSGACNHWGSVAMHDPVPRSHQVNVTLTRYYKGAVFDHRYCYVTPGKANCHTPAILTTDCAAWTYESSAVVYRWDGQWVRIASGSTGRWAPCIAT